MATAKVKFRPSTVEGKEGVIYYQIIKEKMVRQIKTIYKIFPEEWDDHSSQIIVPQYGATRIAHTSTIKERIKLDVSRLSQIILSLDRRGATYTADSIVKAVEKQLKGIALFDFMQSTIARLIELRKLRTSETYKTTLNSFMRFREGEDLLLTDLSSDMMISYEAYLKYENVSMNTISFYMRILRAVYNRAVENELIEQRFPFKKVYTGVDKTVKRALSLKDIKKIKEMDLSLTPELKFARDMFIFSFYTRGMSFVDMAYLRKKDLSNGTISYRRRKTGQQLHIKWEVCMQEILDRYPIFDTQYLLPIITHKRKDDRAQYQYMLSSINSKLKKIAEMVGLSMPLTLYCARHSWASVAKSKNIPLSVISEGMGHDSETTTQIYLASLDNKVVDKANNLILKLL
ncbi:MAG: site-specific integrase [Rikenellaceae bacterium]